MSKSLWIVFAIIILIAAGSGIFLLSQKPETPVQSTVVTDNYQNQISPTTMPESTTAPTPATMDIDPQKTNSVTLTTSVGDITIELDTKNTPLTANNFYHLAKTKFYDKTIFHRIIKGFMIQGGDPTGTGSGGPGYKFKDEYLQGQYTRGTVAMANSGPNTNGSQFFIMHQDNALPNNYVIFGHVTAGLDVLDKIAGSPVTVNDFGEASKPMTPVSIISATVTQK